MRISEEVGSALAEGRPVVALESALITHGLPWRLNADTALAMEAAVRSAGAVPATVAALDGALRVGLEEAEIRRLAGAEGAVKASTGGLAWAVATGRTAGTTVSATMWVANRAGIRWLATGGIGGVHRGGAASWDVSTDLTELGRTPLAVVCSGAKSVLDLRQTLERLETGGTPVVGCETAEFPAFYTRRSGLRLQATVSGPEEAARVWRAHRELGLPGGLLLACPPPTSDADAVELEAAIRTAVREAEEADVRGPAITPHLLRRVAELSGGASLRANVALLRNNARVAGLAAAADAAM